MITRRVRSMDDFHFHTAETDRYFVEGEVAEVVFKNEIAFRSFVKSGVFQEVSLDTPLGSPAISVLRPPDLIVEETVEEVAERIGAPLVANLDEEDLGGQEEDAINERGSRADAIERNQYGLGWQRDKKLQKRRKTKKIG